VSLQNLTSNRYRNLQKQFLPRVRPLYKKVGAVRELPLEFRCVFSSLPSSIRLISANCCALGLQNKRSFCPIRVLFFSGIAPMLPKAALFSGLESSLLGVIFRCVPYQRLWRLLQTVAASQSTNSSAAKSWTNCSFCRSRADRLSLAKLNRHWADSARRWSRCALPLLRFATSALLATPRQRGDSNHRRLFKIEAFRFDAIASAFCNCVFGVPSGGPEESSRQTASPWNFQRHHLPSTVQRCHRQNRLNPELFAQYHRGFSSQPDWLLHKLTRTLSAFGSGHST